MTGMRFITLSGALLGLSSVVMGAAVNHSLAIRDLGDAAHRFDVALRYHQLYAVLLFCMGLYGIKYTPAKTYLLSCLMFLAGICIFSGSLYASLWVDLGPLALGTPIGGILLMAGWVTTSISVFMKQPRP